MNPPKTNRIMSFTVRAVVFLIVLAVGGAVLRFVIATAPTVAKVTQEVQPPQVKVFRAVQAEVRRQWRGFGVAAAIDSADVPARVTATVVERPQEVQAGRPIKAGALLARLDPSDYQKQVEIATERIAELNAQLAQLDAEEKRVSERAKVEADDVALAQSEVTRLEVLQKNRAAEQREVDTAKRVLITAQRSLLLTKEQIDKFEARRSAWRALRAGQESTLKLATVNVERCTIRSPIDGILQAVDVELGESITAGQRVARVVSLAKIEVAVQLPVAARSDVVLGGEVTLTPTSSGSALSWKGKIARVAPEMDASARTLLAFVELDQRETAEYFGAAAGANLVTPGTFVNVVAYASASQQRWVVPRRSVRSDRILLADGGAISSRQVQVDYVHEGALAQFGVTDDQWVVLEGTTPLRDGQLVVVNASIAMRDGDRVQPVLPDGTLTPVAKPDAGKPAEADKSNAGSSRTDKAGSHVAAPSGRLAT